MHVYGVIRSSRDRVGGKSRGPFLPKALQATLVYAGVAPLPQGQVLPASANRLERQRYDRVDHPSTARQGEDRLPGHPTLPPLRLGNLALARRRSTTTASPFGLAAETIGTYRCAT